MSDLPQPLQTSCFPTASSRTRCGSEHSSQVTVMGMTVFFGDRELITRSRVVLSGIGTGLR